MRGAIIAVAVLLYAAAFAVFGAASRLPAPPAPTLIASPSPSAPLSASLPPASAPSPAAAPPAGAEAEQLRLAMQELAREQAANRELVAELRTTVTQLESQLERGRETSPAVRRAGRTLALLGGSLFAPGRVELTPAAREVVERLLPDILSEPGVIVSVEGHTDSQPVRELSDKPFKDNADLSLFRARAVAAVLRDGGVPERNLLTKGWGDARPLDTNDSAEGRERNRRVEIRLLSPASGN